VTLSINLTGTSVNSYDIYELKRNWSEPQATWKQAATGTNWQKAGAQGALDRGSTVLGTIYTRYSSTGIFNLALNAAGLSVVQGWINNPGTNFGFIIQGYASNYNDDKEVPKVVGHHPLGSMLGGIDTDNGEVLTTYFLDTRADDSIGLLQRLSVTWLGSALLTAGSSDVVHVGFSVIEESKGADLNFPSQQSKLPTLQKKYLGDLSVIPGHVLSDPRIHGPPQPLGTSDGTITSVSSISCCLCRCKALSDNAIRKVEAMGRRWNFFSLG
jgi:hypothetical protein